MTTTLLIGNKIKPLNSPTREEHIYGTPYVFADMNQDGHWVAAVTDPDHAELMLSQPDHFYLYPPTTPRITRTVDPAENARRLQQVQEKASAGALEAEQAAAADAAALQALADADKATVSDAALSDAMASADAAIISEARAFLEGDVKKMSSAVQKVSHLSVVTVAAAMETAGQRRAPVLKVLNDVLTLSAGNGQ